MSKNLSAAAQTQFDDEVKQAFQGVGMLRDTVTIRNEVVGDTYKFRKMGKGLANQKPSQAEVTPMDVSHSLVTATLSNWNAPEYTDIFDQAEVNFDERQELAEVIASALGRRLDQLIIDAANAEASPAADIAHGSVGLTVDKLRQTRKAMKKKGVPSSDITFLMSAEGEEDLLASTEVTSSDYNAVKALVQGDVNTFLGMNFMVIEDRDEDGLPLSGSTRTGFAYHKSAIGLAIGMDITAAVDWIAQRTSWLCNGTMKAGAVSRDGDGIVKVNWTE